VFFKDGVTEVVNLALPDAFPISPFKAKIKTAYAGKN
jgi:hypothetical protein